MSLRRLALLCCIATAGCAPRALRQPVPISAPPAAVAVTESAERNDSIQAANASASAAADTVKAGSSERALVDTAARTIVAADTAVVQSAVQVAASPVETVPAEPAQVFPMLSLD